MIVRRAARAIVLDPRDRILLVLFRSPETGEEWWATPGGGLEADEPPEVGLRRELAEETGLEDGEFGRVVWERRHSFRWAGETIDQSETYVVVRVADFEPKPQFTPEELLREGVHDVRWWTLDELAASDANFAPTRIVGFLRQLLEQGPPSAPIDVGV
ncbi:MAG TPA: NUDIX domain-containing protein [Gaiellaceae bacterium]|nr:NUDIX domain-containing protein [Gaiellaceae bacterium]